jgi:molecular chaperone DnaK
MHERQWTEASLKADELLTALDAALPAAGDALSNSDLSTINSAAANVRAARSTSDLTALKAANAALDAATESLAAIIVERAMDAAFERRGLL